jgi:hypothetical protein
MIVAEYMRQGIPIELIEMPLKAFLEAMKEHTKEERSKISAPLHPIVLQWKLMWYRYHYTLLKEG